MLSKFSFAVLVFIIILAIGYGLGSAGSTHSQMLGEELPLFGLLIGLAFIIQWVAFIPALLWRTEKFFDLTGSLTYLSLAILAIYFTDTENTRALLVATLVIIWAGRLGSFLFMRIHQVGKDVRFDAIKPIWYRFFNVWNIQALWVSFTMYAALVVLTSNQSVDMDAFAWFGLGIWIFGFAFEVVADREKTTFRNDSTNEGKFISTGVWAKSRHPNYFGEIVLWTGMLVIAIPVLQGAQWVAVLSPVFVVVLLTKISGIPGLERKADKTWGGREDYEAYKKNTPVLIPKF